MTALYDFKSVTPDPAEAKRLTLLSPLDCESLFSLLGPQLSRPFSVFALELFCHPDQRAENDGAIIVRLVHDAGFEDETAKLDEVFRALPPLDLPRPHIMPCPLRLMTVARRSIAFDGRQGHRHLPQ